MRQIATIIKIKKKNKEEINDNENNYLRTGDTSIVIFRFKKKPEFIQENKQIIFREGQTKGIGWITKILF